MTNANETTTDTFIDLRARCHDQEWEDGQELRQAAALALVEGRITEDEAARLNDLADAY